MPNCRTDICTYDYKYPGKCYHADAQCIGCELHYDGALHYCRCQTQASHIDNDVNYDCQYFEPLREENDGVSSEAQS